MRLVNPDPRVLIPHTITNLTPAGTVVTLGGQRVLAKLVACGETRIKKGRVLHYGRFAKVKICPVCLVPLEYTQVGIAFADAASPRPAWTVQLSDSTTAAIVGWTENGTRTMDDVLEALQFTSEFYNPVAQLRYAVAIYWQNLRRKKDRELFGSLNVLQRAQVALAAHRLNPNT